MRRVDQLLVAPSDELEGELDEAVADAYGLTAPERREIGMEE